MPSGGRGSGSPRRLARRAYRWVQASPAHRLVGVSVVRALRTRWPPRATVSDLLQVMALLDAAGARAWIVGGWGVDALVGYQTRAHHDIDVAFEAGSCGEDKVVATFTAAGFALIDPDAPSGVGWPRRLWFETPSGRGVDLLPVALGEEASGNAEVAQLLPEDVASGTVDGAALPCLSVAAQLRLHEGYDDKVRLRDVLVLCQRFGLPPPAWATQPPPPAPSRAAGGGRRRRQPSGEGE